MLLSIFIFLSVTGFMLIVFGLFISVDSSSRLLSCVASISLGALLIMCGARIGSSKEFYLKTQVEKHLKTCLNSAEFVNSISSRSTNKPYKLEDNGYSIGPYTKGFVLKHNDFYLYITDNKIENTEDYETYKNDNVTVLVIDDEAPSLINNSNSEAEAK